jgi:succinyl-CoA synthetase beta subunit
VSQRRYARNCEEGFRNSSQRSQSEEHLHQYFRRYVDNISLDYLLNSFGAGIMRCDYIAEGVIKATKELNLEIPLVVRLKGTKELEAKEYLMPFCGSHCLMLTFSLSIG